MTSLRILLLIATTILVTRANAQPPTYATGLDEFEVRSLSGAYAPTNGNTALEDAITDQAWFTLFGKSNVRSIVNSWNGGAADEASRKLYVHGGGHGDGAYNGIVVFDFTGDTNPVGWSEVPGSLSDTGAIPPLPGGGNASDGRPGAVHSYDGLQFDAATNRLIRVGGSLWGPGAFTKDTWAFDFGSGSWEKLAPDNLSGEPGTPASVINVQARRFLHINHKSGSSEANFYNLDNNVWSGGRDIENFTFHHTAVWDPVRDQVLVVRDGPEALLSDIDWNGSSFTSGNFSVTGATAGLEDEAISMWFDPVRDSIWVLGGRDEPRFNKIWEITNLGASDKRFTITEYPLSGDTIVVDGSRGSYGRFIFFNDWRMVGFVTAHDEPTYIIKLPGEAGDPPPPPPEVRIPPDDVVIQ